MHRPLRPAPLLAVTVLAASVHAQTPAPAAPDTPKREPQQLDRVEVTNQATDESKRRASTASKIVISREDLLRFGDGNLTDLMRRLPGVTPGGRPGRGGEIRMRGMGGGFTQILVNGERMAPGFSIDQIAPDQIERIEIQRAPTAETGARAVAGTINILLREPLAKKLHELRVQFGGDHGEPQMNVAWTRNDALSEALTYTWTVVLNGHRRGDDIDIRVTQQPSSEAPSTVREQQGRSLDVRHALNTNARVLWKLGESSTLALMPYAVLARGRSESTFTQSGEPRYTRVDTEGKGHFGMLRGTALLQSRLSESARLELRGGGGRTSLTQDSERLEGGGLQDRRQTDHTVNRDDNASLVGKLTVQTATDHHWVSGVETEWGERQNTRTTLQNGLPLQGLGDFGDQLSARTLRWAGYTQDEWQAAPGWNLHAGLRWESINSRGDAGAATGTVDHTSRVLSPLLHALWKPDPKGRDQVRFSLTRSYRAPDLNNLIARPVLNSQYPSGPNPEFAPDRAGNPTLKPELARGLELAFEHYLGKSGVLSVNVFARDIDGLIRNQLTQETVLLGGVPTLRWVSRPVNFDHATTQGVELEAKGRLDEFLDTPGPLWAPLQLRANLSLFRSHVDGLPEPHNRIDAQPRATANLGADYRLPGTGWAFGANWSWTPEVLIQQTDIVRVRASRRQVLDAYVQYTQSRDLSWRLGLSNLAPLDALSQTVVSSGSALVSTDDRKRTFTTWTLRSEMRF